MTMLRRRLLSVQRFLQQRGEAFDFSRIPDRRRRQGRRWTLSALLTTATLALLTVGRSLRGAERLSSDLLAVRDRRGHRRRVPDSTLGDALAHTAPAPLREHLHREVLAEHRRKALEPTVLPLRAVSVDGKTVASLDAEWHKDCQRQQQEGQPPKWYYRVVRASLISAAAAVCVDQQPIPAATNDGGVFPAFFAALLTTYRRANLFEVVVTDAGFMSEANARLIHDAGYGYVMRLKANQPDLEREAQRVLREQALSQPPEAETPWEHDASHKNVRRQLWRTTEMAGWGRWPHLRQVWLVRVWGRPCKGQPERVVEDRYYVTNLVPGRLDGAGILALVRAHWRIENDCFNTLDVRWQEDHGRWVRRGHGLPTVSLLRMLAYNLLSLLRAVHLRSPVARCAAWEQLRDWVRDALVWRHLLLEVTATGTPSPNTR